LNPRRDTLIFLPGRLLPAGAHAMPLLRRPEHTSRAAPGARFTFMS